MVKMNTNLEYFSAQSHNEALCSSASRTTSPMICRRSLCSVSGN